MEPGGAWRTRETQELQTGTDFQSVIGVRLLSGTDVRVRVIDVSDNNTFASAQFDIIEVPIG